MSFVPINLMEEEEEAADAWLTPARVQVNLPGDEELCTHHRHKPECPDCLSIHARTLREDDFPTTNLHSSAPNSARASLADLRTNTSRIPKPQVSNGNCNGQSHGSTAADVPSPGAPVDTGSKSGQVTLAAGGSRQQPNAVSASSSNRGTPRSKPVSATRPTVQQPVPTLRNSSLRQSYQSSTSSVVVTTNTTSSAFTSGMPAVSTSSPVPRSVATQQQDISPVPLADHGLPARSWSQQQTRRDTSVTAVELPSVSACPCETAAQFTSRLDAVTSPLHADSDATSATTRSTTRAAPVIANDLWLSQGKSSTEPHTVPSSTVPPSGQDTHEGIASLGPARRATTKLNDSNKLAAPAWTLGRNQGIALNVSWGSVPNVQSSFRFQPKETKTAGSQVTPAKIGSKKGTAKSPDAPDASITVVAASNKLPHRTSNPISSAPTTRKPSSLKRTASASPPQPVTATAVGSPAALLQSNSSQSFAVKADKCDSDVVASARSSGSAPAVATRAAGVQVAETSCTIGTALVGPVDLATEKTEKEAVMTNVLVGPGHDAALAERVHAVVLCNSLVMDLMQQVDEEVQANQVRIKAAAQTSNKQLQGSHAKLAHAQSGGCGVGCTVM